jgi:hypothetical protein
MQSTPETPLTELVHEAANPLTGAAQDYDPLNQEKGFAAVAADWPDTERLSHCFRAWLGRATPETN